MCTISIGISVHRLRPIAIVFRVFRIYRLTRKAFFSKKSKKSRNFVKFFKIFMFFRDFSTNPPPLGGPPRGADCKKGLNLARNGVPDPIFPENGGRQGPQDPGPRTRSGLEFRPDRVRPRRENPAEPVHFSGFPENGPARPGPHFPEMGSGPTQASQA